MCNMSCQERIFISADFQKMMKKYILDQNISMVYINDLDYTTSMSMSYYPYSALYRNSTSVTTSQYFYPIVASDRIREIIKSRLSPAIRSRRKVSLSICTDFREIRARQTLRCLIGNKLFRKFIRDGFITIRGKSGLLYQLYPGYGMTKVYNQGIMVDKLCVILKDNFPPTDFLIMRYLLILNNEEDFIQNSIKHTVDSIANKCNDLKSTKPYSLVDIWNQLRVRDVRVRRQEDETLLKDAQSKYVGAMGLEQSLFS